MDVTIDELRAKATERTGLSDFGDDRYVEGLEILLAAYAENPYFNDVGRLSALGFVHSALCGRLESEEGWKRDDRWRTTSIVRPLFILGLPRTGTTALHKMIAQDPSFQSLPYWLGQHPQPRPRREEWSANRSFRDTKAYLDVVHERTPQMRVMHDMQADEPDECRLLRMQSFADFTFDGAAWIPSYVRWLASVDQRATYARYRDNLRLIASGDERQWVLKCPGHLLWLDALLEAFPDACVVQTHRAPDEAIVSSSSLRYQSSRMTQPSIPPEVVGLSSIERWEGSLDRAHLVRKQHDPARFYDMDFRTFVADPLGEVQRIYSYFGVEMTGDARDAMTKWHGERPRHQHGEHRYAPEDFGFTASSIRARFAAYCERHGV